MLHNLAPVILGTPGSGAIGAAWLNKAKPSQDIVLGDYTLRVELRRSTRDQGFLSELGYGLAVALGANEFLIAGSDVQVTFQPRTPGPAIAGIAEAEVGRFEDGHWGRRARSTATTSSSITSWPSRPRQSIGQRIALPARATGHPAGETLSI